jgi:steroid delta-isomerase-like uncharacterized protein
METNGLTLGRALRAGVLAGLLLSGSLGANAAQSTQVEVNKAVVKRYLEAEGTAGFAGVLKEVQAAGHKQLRYEFHNLKYNADNSELAKLGQPDYKAIPDRSNEITRLLGEGDMVAATIHVKGTHKGNFYGIPATGKSFDFDEVAIFKLANGKITETFLMADEARFMRQIGARLPARKDGKLIAPPIPDDTREGDVVLNELLAHPVDSQQYRNKVLMVGYKAKTKPPGYAFTGRPYGNNTRAGNQNTVDMLKDIKTATGKDVSGNFGAAWQDRQDRIANVIADGNQGMMQFRLNAKNGGPLYTIPASNKQIQSWEICFAEFDGEKWQTAWFIGDELGMMLQIGSQQAVSFLLDDINTPR